MRSGDTLFLGSAVGVGLTRVYLGVHYPSDVVAGWAPSVAIVGVTWLAFAERLGPVSRDRLVAAPAEPRATAAGRDEGHPAQGG